MATNAGAEATGRSVSPGQIGTLAQLIFAGAIGAIGLAVAEPSPEPLSRGVALGLLLAAPAAVGWLGTVAGRRSLLLAAVVADVAAVPLSFTGITLLFLVPATLFVAEAARVPQRGETTGARLGRAIVGVGIAGLLVGAGFMLLALTEPLCWIATPGPGGLSFQVVPGTAGASISGGQAAGCDGAALTLQGIGLAAVLAIGAIALSAVIAGGKLGLRGSPGDPPPS